jgi:hypothetical protein
LRSVFCFYQFQRLRRGNKKTRPGDTRAGHLEVHSKGATEESIGLVLFMTQPSFFIDDDYGRVAHQNRRTTSRHPIQVTLDANQAAPVDTDKTGQYTATLLVNTESDTAGQRSLGKRRSWAKHSLACSGHHPSSESVEHQHLPPPLDEDPQQPCPASRLVASRLAARLPQLAPGLPLHKNASNQEQPVRH